ncbi:MAG: low molecular weight protein-tyrosine-phosphatase [Cyanobacteria bacterium P01_F01_bin.33]
MPPSNRLLFVCLGNICRSPTAENVMRYLVEEAGLSDRITCDSAGTSSYHIGSPPDRRMQQAARAKGMTLTGEARQFRAEDLEAFDLILAMDRQNYRDILLLDPERRFADKVKMMCDYCTEYPDREVPDPYYGGGDGFRYVVELLQDACSGLLREMAV